MAKLRDCLKKSNLELVYQNEVLRVADLARSTEESAVQEILDDVENELKGYYDQLGVKYPEPPAEPQKTIEDRVAELRRLNQERLDLIEDIKDREADLAAADKRSETAKTAEAKKEYAKRRKQVEKRLSQTRKDMFAAEKAYEGFRSMYPTAAAMYDQELKEQAGSPLQQALNAFREQEPGALIAVRIGDFVELFGNDADIASDLTGEKTAVRPKVGKMTGFNFVNKWDDALKAMLEAGHTVAYAESVKGAYEIQRVYKPEQARAPKPRDVGKLKPKDVAVHDQGLLNQYKKLKKDWKGIDPTSSKAMFLQDLEEYLRDSNPKTANLAETVKQWEADLDTEKMAGRLPGPDVVEAAKKRLHKRINLHTSAKGAGVKIPLADPISEESLFRLLGGFQEVLDYWKNPPAPKKTKAPKKPKAPPEAELGGKAEVPERQKRALLENVKQKMTDLLQEAKKEGIWKPVQVVMEGNAAVADNTLTVRSEWEKKGKKYLVDMMIYGGGPVENMKFTVDSEEDAVYLTELASAGGKGQITVKVPGSQYKIPNTGAHLLWLEKQLTNLATRTTKKPKTVPKKPMGIEKEADYAFKLYWEKEKGKSWNMREPYRKVKEQLAQVEAELKENGEWDKATANRHRALLEELYKRSDLPALERDESSARYKFQRLSDQAKIIRKEIDRLKKLKRQTKQVENKISREEKDLAAKEAEIAKAKQELEPKVAALREARIDIGLEVEETPDDVRDELQSTGQYPLRIPGEELTPLEEAQQVAKELGLTMSAKQQTGAVAIPENLEDLPAEEQAIYRALLEARKPQWEFTDKSRPKGDPMRGVTFYTPVDATPEQIRARFAEKQAEFTKQPPMPAPPEGDPNAVREPTDQTFEEKIPGVPKGYPDIFTMSDEELGQFFEGEGELVLEGRAGKYTFPTYDAYSRYMADRYAERDLEGMMLAFKEADSKWKIRYVREVQKSGNDHLKAWVSHLATGSPVPKEDPPMPRTSPRPTASGEPEPEPAAPDEPPPPPDEPAPERFEDSEYDKFNVTALAQLMRLFGKNVRINQRLRTAYGRYKFKMGRGREKQQLPTEDAIELMDRIFQDPKLAKRVMAHEIGHFIDIGVREGGYGLPFAPRLRPLMAAWLGEIKEVKALRDDAARLSGEWRGRFGPDDEYRNDPNELFADFMSAMLVNPDWVNRKYPRLHDQFTQGLLPQKEDFGKAFQAIQDFLQGKTLVKEVRRRMTESREKTFEKIAKENDDNRSRLRQIWDGTIDFLTALRKSSEQTLVTQWHVANRRERMGPGREKALTIGKSLKDHLEVSHSWGILQDQLFADDFENTVMPIIREIAGVKLRPAKFMKFIPRFRQQRPMEMSKEDQKKVSQVMDLLNQYNQARRTLLERRVAGEWIKDNPDAAREMLEAVMAAAGPDISNRFGGQLEGVPDSGLYDFAAQVFYHIYVKGKQNPVYIENLMQLIDDMDLDITGHDAMMAFNVRGKMLNPEGLSEDTARELLNELRQEMGDANYAKLGQAAKQLRELFFQIQKAAKKEGLISQRTWEKLIVPNRDNYVPYAVLDYFHGRVRAGVMPQMGTMKELADTTTAMQLKASSLNNWRQHQRQVALVAEMYRRGGSPPEISARPLKKLSDIHAIRKRNSKDDKSRAVYWVDGRPHLITFDGDPTKSLEEAFDSASFYNQIQWLSGVGRAVQGLMQLYTTLTLSFQFYRNPYRDMRTTMDRISFRKTFQQYNPFTNRFWRSVRLAYHYAQAAQGNTMNPELRELVEQEAIPMPRLATPMLRDMANLTEFMAYSTILSQQVRYGMREAGTPSPFEKFWRSNVMLPARLPFMAASWIRRRLFNLFTAYEAFSKLQAFKASKEKGMDLDEAYGMTRRAGIPRPGVGGSRSMIAEIFVPWFRVATQGARTELEMVRDPKKRKGFLVRAGMFEFAPRMMKFLIGVGVVGGTVRWILSGGEEDDPDDPVMAEVIRRISPYKLALDNIVPLYLRDTRTGEIHNFRDFKKGSDIPKHYEVVSMRIPSSEEGKLFGTLFYNMLVTTAPGGDELARPGDNPFKAMGGWLTNYLMPGLNPLGETVINTGRLAGGEKVRDSYTGNIAVNEQLYDAGGWARTQSIVGYALRSVGGPGKGLGLALTELGWLDERAMDPFARLEEGDPSLATRLTKAPPLSSVFTYDNYADYRERKITDLEEQKLRAQSKLIMSDQVRQMYDYYWRNKDRKDEMDATDYGKLKAASDFVHKVWGDLQSPDSFYNKASYAATEGSKENKASVRQDLDLASAPYLATFMNPEAARFTAVLHLSSSKTVRAEFDAAAYQVYDGFLQENYDRVDEVLRTDPYYQKSDLERRREIRGEARQLARENAAARFLEESRSRKK